MSSDRPVPAAAGPKGHRWSAPLLFRIERHLHCFEILMAGEYRTFYSYLFHCRSMAVVLHRLRSRGSVALGPPVSRGPTLPVQGNVTQATAYSDSRYCS